MKSCGYFTVPEKHPGTGQNKARCDSTPGDQKAPPNFSQPTEFGRWQWARLASLPVCRTTGTMTHSTHWGGRRCAAVTLRASPRGGSVQIAAQFVERATAWREAAPFVVIIGNINLLFLYNFTADRPLQTAPPCTIAQDSTRQKSGSGNQLDEGQAI